MRYTEDSRSWMRHTEASRNSVVKAGMRLIKCNACLIQSTLGSILAGSSTHSVSKSRPGILQDTVKSVSVANSLQGLHNFQAMRDLTKIGCNADGCRHASCSFDCLFTLLAWYIDAGVQNKLLWCQPTLVA